MEAGGLTSYGADYNDLHRRAAVYVDKILKGVKPADLPVEQASKYELIINLETAKRSASRFRESLLLRADKVIAATSLLALSRHGSMSDLSPLRAPNRTSI